MGSEYSVAVYRKLKDEFEKAALHRPMRFERYEPGDELAYDVTGVTGANRGSIRLVIEDFVGGGFAGQVYRVKVLEMGASSGPIGGLAVGGVYALKIFIPPTTFSQLFRNTLYWIGFQGPFQIQVNPTAARSGALWQKFIRRAARIRFGDERAVVDIHATLVDDRLGSCGEVSEWIGGRTWRLEVDEHLELLKAWKKHRDSIPHNLGSPEYRAKYLFMHEFVGLLHTMGCHEFARQYEWSTCKSQPNCLKRSDTEDDPSAGLMAVDFRAGLAKTIGIGFFRFLIWVACKRKITDPTSGYQCLSRKVFEGFTKDLFPTDYPDADVILMLFRVGYRIREVPVSMMQNPAGKSMHRGIFRLMYYFFKMCLSFFVTLLREKK